jgi:hypothetical protein
MIRARSWPIWPSRSRWAGTAWPTLRYCAPSRALFGPVASDPVISRLVSRLAGDVPAALKAIGNARAAARERAWQLAGQSAPGAGDGPLIVDIDATLVTAHSEKERAAPTWKKGFGFHPLTVFADRGAEGNGEPLDPAARPARPGPPMGTQAAAAAPVLGGRAHRPRRPSAAAGIRMALGQTDHRHHSATPGAGARLIEPFCPCDQEGATRGLWNPAHPARQRWAGKWF